MRFLFIVLALAACKKVEKAPTADDKPKVAAIDPTLFGGDCKQEFDCAQPPMFAECRVDCAKPIGAPAGYCQLQQISAEVGAKFCIGNHQGVGTSGTGGTGEKWPLVVNCDIDKGVYCEDKSHTCVATKALGAACAQTAECGKDGVCDQNKCVAAGAPGQADVSGRCDSKSYWVEGKCVALVADAGQCKESGQCASGNCVYKGAGEPGSCQAKKHVDCVFTKK